MEGRNSEKLLNRIFWLLAAAPAAVGVFLLAVLPGAIPVWWPFNGAEGSYGSKYELVIVIVAALAVVVCLKLLYGWLQKSAWDGGDRMDELVLRYAPVVAAALAGVVELGIFLRIWLSLG